MMQQIPTNFQIDNEITTPLSAQPHTMALKSYPNMLRKATNIPTVNMFPNHRYDVRRRLEEINRPRPFEYIIRGTPPTGFQRTHSNSSDFPQIPKEYEGTVNSIQDILTQDSGRNYHDSDGIHKIKIAGTYKHRKIDDLAGMFESTARKNRDQPTVDEPDKTKSHDVIRDPFYKYKPVTLSDVNLMATNQFRFAPYNVLTNKYVGQSSMMDPGNLYHQIIMANKNRLKYLDDNSKNDNLHIQSKQKPFTLMLDVYPMPDDEHLSSTAPLPVKYQNKFNSHPIRHPGIGSINSLQPHYFHNTNYHHLKANRYPNLPHYNNPNYFRKFGEKHFNSPFFAPNDRDGKGNNPSQITVHLNLFPKKKERSNDHNQNAEIFNKNDKVPQEEGDANSISVRLQDRMAKLGIKGNRTNEDDNPSNKESKVSNKVDMDMLLSTTTVASVKHNVIVIDESDDAIDSTEDIFRKEFLQFQTTDSPGEFLSDFSTFESKSGDSFQHNSIPTVLPIEPRGYKHHH